MSLPKEDMIVSRILDDNGVAIGVVTKWNPVGLGEVIVQFYDGSADSCMFNELRFQNDPEIVREFLNAREP
jgi:hypothetical protein